MKVENPLGIGKNTFLMGETLISGGIPTDPPSPLSFPL